MSLLRRIFKGRSFEEECAEAESLLARGDAGLAKLAFERALSRKEGVAADRMDAVRRKVDLCCDQIARGQLERARGHFGADDIEAALTDANGALEIVRDSVLRKEIQALLDAIDQKDAREHAAPAAALSPEERLVLIAGSWEEEQAQEYATYGARFEDAIVALSEGDAAKARPMLEEILASAPDPHYLVLELGRAHLMLNDAAAAEEKLRKFLASIGPEEGGNARLSAHVELARIADERKDGETAIAELQAAVEALPGDYRPFFWLGRLLRTQGHAAESVEVLKSAVDLLDESQPDWSVYQELGLAHAAAGDSPAAIEAFEVVVAFFARRNDLDLPTTTAIPLAKLQEQAGKRERAADLYRTLTHGSDVDNHLVYHREAARLLREIGLRDEARRMLMRAQALAETEEARAQVAADMVLVEQA